MKILILFALFSLSARAENLSDALKTIGYKNEKLKTASVLRNLQRKGSKKTFTNLKFEFNKNIYELEAASPLTAAESERERNNVMGVIVQSYSDQPTPYSGEITNIAKCSKEFQPKIKKQIKVGDKSISLLESYIDKSYNYGVCEKKLVKYTACTSFFFDSAKSQNIKLKIVTEPDRNCEELSVSFYRDLQ